MTTWTPSDGRALPAPAAAARMRLPAPDNPTRGVMREQQARQFLDMVEPELDAVRRTIAQRAMAREAIAEQRVRKDEFVASVLPGTGRAFSRIAAEAERQLAALDRREDLSGTGKHLEARQLLERRAAALVQLGRERLGAAGDAFLARWGAKPQPALTADLAAEVAALAATFGQQLATRHFRDALDLLKIALDMVGQEDAAIGRANALLRAHYHPTLERRGTSPERWAIELAPACAELAELLELHLANDAGDLEHRIAARILGAARQQYESLFRGLGEHGAWVGAADVLLVGASELWPGYQPGQVSAE